MKYPAIWLLHKKKTKSEEEKINTARLDHQKPVINLFVGKQQWKCLFLLGSLAGKGLKEQDYLVQFLNAVKRCNVVDWTFNINKRQVITIYLNNCFGIGHPPYFLVKSPLKTLYVIFTFCVCSTLMLYHSISKAEDRNSVLPVKSHSMEG